jgi:prepilin-type N-terminal cleavage/methylation domain-containing protein
MRLRHRPGVTLLEVLIAIFIMAIGMLALLTLFPIGALEMARALRNQRATDSSVLAESVAMMEDIRHDPIVVTPIATDPTGWTDAFVNPFGTPLDPSIPGPSNGVFVDPYLSQFDPTSTIGALSLAGPPVTTVTPGMRRRSISLTNWAGRPPLTKLSGAECDRWCSLLDDLLFNSDATPNTTLGIERGGKWTWSWLLRRPNAYTDSTVEMSIVVYHSRDVKSGTVSGETVYPGVGPAVAPLTVAVAGTAGTNAVKIDYSATGVPPNVRLGRWVMDVSPNNATDALNPTAPAHNGAVPGYFYRIVNYADLGSNTMLLEFETNLKQDVTAIVVMDDVEEVFDKVIGWQP